MVKRPLVTGHQTLYQPIVSETHAMGIEFTNNPASSKRVLLPLESDFSNMSDLSVIVEPPDNNWRSDNRQAQTLLSGRISRRDQSRTKHKSKKRRRRRSSSTSSSSRSASSDSHKRSRKSKRSKHSHKERRRSSSSLSDNQSHDYGRYKRSRHSPQAAQNPSILQPAEITNVQTIPLNRLCNALHRTQVQVPKSKLMKLSGFCLRSYAQGQPRRYSGKASIWHRTSNGVACDS